MEYNPIDPEVNRNIYEAVLRLGAPTYCTPPGLLAVSHYEDVLTILRDHDRFASAAARPAARGST